MYYHLRKSYVFLLLITLICFVIVTCRNCDKEASKDVHDSAREKLRQKGDKLKHILNKHPGDAQLRLGAAELLRIGGGLEWVPKNLTPTKMYEMAVKLDPTNRGAQAYLMRRTASKLAGRLGRYYKELKKADEMEAGKIKLPEGNPLYEYSKTESGRKVMAENKRRSAASRRPTLEEKADLLARLKRSGDMDPDNALYNYLSASIYFVEGEKEKAIREIEKGLKKKYVSLYTKERLEARQRLIDEIDFPSPERELLLTTHTSFGMRWHLCDDLIEIGKESQKNDKFDQAEEFYSMVLRMAEQTREDHFWVMQEVRTWELLQYSLQHLEELYEDMKEEKKRDEVMNRLERAESRMKYLFDLWEKAPSYDNIAKIRFYANEVVKKGELKVLELLPSK